MSKYSEMFAEEFIGYEWAVEKDIKLHATRITLSFYGHEEELYIENHVFVGRSQEELDLILLEYFRELKKKFDRIISERLTELESAVNRNYSLMTNYKRGRNK